MSNENVARNSELLDLKPTRNGLSDAELSQVPLIKASIERIQNEARNEAYEEAYLQGLEDGKQAAYKESKAEYDKNLLNFFDLNVAAFDEIVSVLKRPLESLPSEVEAEIKNSFMGCLEPVVTNPEVYDLKIAHSLAEFVAQHQSNNRVVRIKLKDKLNDVFFEFLTKFDVEVEKVDMDDVIRVECESGNFRFSHIEHVRQIVSESL